MLLALQQQFAASCSVHLSIPNCELKVSAAVIHFIVVCHSPCCVVDYNQVARQRAVATALLQFTKGDGPCLFEFPASWEV
jgi:hypothetical protein